MSEITRNKSLGQFDQTFVELQSRDPSRMNQGIWDSHRIIDGSRKNNYIEPTVIRKIKTKNYNCYEERYVEHTKCLNNFYMSKLNCTFPWLESTKQSEEKCGANHFIKDLFDLIDNVSTGK